MPDMTFYGTGVALITPFTAGKEVDYPAISKIVEHLVVNKIEYLVLLGTTAEAATLDAEEKKEIVRFAIEKVNGRIPVVIGIGGNDTRGIVKTIQNTDFKGLSGILSVSPYYNKPTEEGLFQHYAAIAEASPLPLILYNIPGRTASNMSAELTLRLAHKFSNIIAIKEASGNMEQCMRIIRDKPENFTVISGDDALTLPSLSIGMKGVISVAAHAAPYEFSEMVRQGIAGNFNEARKLHYSLLEMMTSIFHEGNPGGIKAILHSKGLCENELRLPLYKVSDNLYQKLAGLNW